MKFLKTQKVFQNGLFVCLFRLCGGVEMVFRDIKKAVNVHRFDYMILTGLSAAQAAFYILHVRLEVLVYLNLVTNHIAGMQYCCVIALSYVGSNLGS